VKDELEFELELELETFVACDDADRVLRVVLGPGSRPSLLIRLIMGPDALTILLSTYIFFSFDP
jgi:hypothetical protein